MTTQTSSQSGLSLGQRMLIGAGIGFALISIFIFPVKPNPTWGRLWMVQPLIMVTLAGAMGGLCNYFILTFHKNVGLNRIMATIISVLVFIIGLWMGIILGLNGTMWN